MGRLVPLSAPVVLTDYTGAYVQPLIHNTMKAKTLHEVITSMMKDNSEVQRRLYKAVEDEKDEKTLALYNKVLDQVCASYNAMLEADTELRRHLNLL